MTDVVAEFSAWNDFDLRQAFTQACRDVSEQTSVPVVDAMHAKSEARAEVALAVYAAHRDAIFAEPCTTALADLMQRQFDDIRMALGIAATGAATAADVTALASSLGAQPPGALREVVAAPGIQDLYDHIVRWLEVVVASRPTDAGLEHTLAGEAATTISENLPTSSVTPVNQFKLRPRP